MMINFTLILLFNLIFIFSSGKLVSSSCMDKAVGERVEISLDIGELPEESELTWRHNQTRVYNKKGSKVKTRNLDVDRYGSLILENVQKKHSGVYEGKVYDKEGKLIKSSTHRLCVQEPVPKPTVIVEYATIANEETNSTKEENSNDENRNEEVLSGKTKLLFGLDFWWMLVILTGGASSLLVLFIICLVCVCRCHARNKRKATKEAEFRLVSLMPDCTDQPDVPYMQKTESNRPSKSVRPLPPLPSSRGPPPLQPQ